MELNELLIEENDSKKEKEIIKFMVKKRQNNERIISALKRIFLYIDLFLLEICMFRYYCEYCKMKNCSKYIDCLLCGERNCRNCQIGIRNHSTDYCIMKRLLNEFIFNFIWAPIILKILYSPLIYSLFIVKFLLGMTNIFFIGMIFSCFKNVFFDNLGIRNIVINYVIEVLKNHCCFFFHIIIISYFLLLALSEIGRLSISFSLCIIFFYYFMRYLKNNFKNNYYY